MAFDVGALVSKLKLDSTSFNTSATAAEKKAGSLGGAMGRSGAAFKKAGMAMTVAGGAIVGALGLMINKAAKAGDEIHKMSLRTGISATALSELKHAAEISGASLGDVEKGVKKMAKSMTDADAGLATYLRSFERIGISMEDLKGLKPEEQMLLIGEAIAGLASESEKAATAQEIFGRAGTNLLPLFKEGAIGIEKLREEAHKLGVVFDTEAAAKAAALVDAQTRLKASMTGVTQNIALSLMPILTNLVEGIAKTISKISDWIKENPKLAETILKVGAGLGILMAALGPLMMMLPGIVAIAPAVGAAFTTMLGPIGLLAAAAIATAAALEKLRKQSEKTVDADYNNYEALEKMKNKLKEAADAAGLTRVEFHQLMLKYDENTTALASAIVKGEEGVELQESLAKVGKEHKEAIDEQREALEDETETLTDGLIPALEDTKDKAESLSDFLKTQGIKTIKEKNKRVKELNKHLEELAESYENGTITLDDYTEASEAAKDELEELTSEIDGTRKAEKLLTDYLQDKGIPTTEEKTDKVNDLKTILGELERAYKDGRISMEDFINATAAAKRELEDLSSEITITAIPAARDMSGVWEQAVSEMEDNTEGFVRDGVKPKFLEIGTAAAALTDGLKTKWASAFGEMLRGQGKFKIDLKGMWDGIYTQFTDILGSMFSDFLAGGKNAFDGLAAILTSPAGFIAACYLGVKAIWAAGEALSDFLMGAGLNANWQEQKDRLDEYRQKWIDLGYSIEEANEKYNEWLKLTGQGDPGEDIPGRGGLPPGPTRPGTWGGGGGSLRPGADEGGGFAIGGITAPYPHAINVGEKYEKEYIVPESKLMNLVGKILETGSKAGGAGRNSPVFNLNMSPTVQLMGTISGAGFDPTALQAQIRGTIVPQILQDLLSNLQKSEWQKALGLI